MSFFSKISQIYKSYRLFYNQMTRINIKLTLWYAIQLIFRFPVPQKCVIRLQTP